MNSSQHLSTEIELALAEIPVLDAHTHLAGGRLGARGLHDILLYHMLISDFTPPVEPAYPSVKPQLHFPKDVME